MPDHLHWLFSLQSGTLGGVLRQVKGGSSAGMNVPGRIWQPGYHDRALRKEEDLVAAARYLVANPVRKGLVKEAIEYPHWDAVWFAPS